MLFAQAKSQRFNLHKQESPTFYKVGLSLRYYYAVGLGVMVKP